MGNGTRGREYGPPFYLICAVSVLLSLILLFSGRGAHPLCFSVYATAVYTLIRCATVLGYRAVRWVRRRLERYSLTRSLVRDYRFNTVFFTYVSLAINLGYAVFKLFLCARTSSLWFGVLAAYYAVLGISRYLILDSRRRAMSEPDAKMRRLCLYRTQKMSGVMVLVMTGALLAAVWQMVLEDRSFSVLPYRFLYAVAVYTVYKVAAAAGGVLRSRSLQDPALSAVREIGYADALVSLFALQGSLLLVFGGEKASARQFYNALTGNLVCVLVLALGIYMVVRARHGIAALSEQGHGESGGASHRLPGRDGE